MEFEKKTEYFECECLSIKHLIKFTIFEWVENKYELILFTQLNNYLSFWQRVKVGLSYIFRFQHTFCDFDETLIRPEDIPRLRSVLDEFEKLNRKETNE